jgi:uncharacterized integral membrane protein
MNDNLLKRTDFGHSTFVVFVICFHVWFLIDVWGVSSRIEHLMFVVPLTFVAFGLGAFILISLHQSLDSQTSQVNLKPIDIRIPLIMFALCAYLVGMVFAGFDLSTFLFLSYSLWLMGERRLWVIFFYSFSLTVFCVFGLREMVSLPVPTFFFAET